MTNSHNTVYVGSYATADAPGIHAFTFDTTTGALTAKGSSAGIAHPSFILAHPNRRWLYAVSEQSEQVDGKAGAIWGLALDNIGAQANSPLLNSQASGGNWPCHLALDASGKWLVVSNYSSGTVAVFPIQDDGSLGAMSELIQHHGSGPNPERQEGPHAHSATFTPDNRFLIVADLGIDQLVIYAFDPVKGTLKAHAQVHARPGAGPRHMAFHPQRPQLAVACELDNTVVIYDYTMEDCRLEARQAIETLPSGAPESAVADIHFAPSGEWLYVSNRGHNSIAAFAAAPDGEWQRLATASTGGDWPRNFAIAPDERFLLVANQYSGEITVLSVVEGEQALGEPVARIAVPGASCIQFVSRES